MSSAINFDIVSLSERPEYAETCAAWSFSEWGCHMPGLSLEKSIENYKTRAKNKDALDLVWVGFENGKAAGMISLKKEDHPDRKDLTPWLGSMFVHPAYRGRGYAGALISRLHEEAKKLGFEKLSLFTPDAGKLYEKHGWQAIGKVSDPRNLREYETLMEKNL